MDTTTVQLSEDHRLAIDTDFRRHHLYDYVEKRVKKVAPGTVNKDIAALKKMLSFALDTEVIEDFSGDRGQECER